jgi:hypothetical protein
VAMIVPGGFINMTAQFVLLAGMGGNLQAEQGKKNPSRFIKNGVHD